MQTQGAVLYAQLIAAHKGMTLDEYVRATFVNSIFSTEREKEFETRGSCGAIDRTKAGKAIFYTTSNSNQSVSMTHASAPPGAAGGFLGAHLSPENEPRNLPFVAPDFTTTLYYVCIAKGQETTTGIALAIRSRAEAVERVKAQARAIADAPDLRELPDEVLQKLAQAVAVDNWKAKLKGEADRVAIDCEVDRELWLGQASRTGSKRTKDLYRRAITRLEAWCRSQGIEVLELTPGTADQWIAHLREQGRASATVRLDVAAASAFWTQLERWDKWLRNAFRGTRARPAKQACHEVVTPSEAEVETLEAEAKGWLRAAVVVMARAGLRVGALPSLKVSGTIWSAVTKGKVQRGKIPEVGRKAIEQAGLSLRGPFAERTAQVIKDSFPVLVNRLCAAGKLEAVYSAHDLRHAFAVRLYKRTIDICRVQNALGHASVSVTEGYLRSLGLTS